MNKFLKAFDALAVETEARQDAIIAQVRESLLIPFCERSGMRFTAGMGSWSFDYCDRYGRHQCIHDWVDLKSKRIPVTLYDFLIENAITSRNDLGAIMQSYTPTTYKA